MSGDSRGLLGSAEAASTLMQELKSFAASTPFEFPELADAAKKMVAFGIAADQVQPSLKMIGDLAAGLGQPVGELAEIYGKLKTQGKLYGDDLKQLGGRGIPIIRALAQTMGVAESQVAGLVSEGKVGFPMVQKALQSLTANGGQFAGMMEKQSKTLAGLWSTLTDNISMTLAGLVQTIIDAFGIKDALSALANGIGTAGGYIQNAVATYAPIIVGFAKQIWQGTTAAFQAIYNFVAPTVASIVRWVSDNWRTMLESAIGYYNSLYNLVSSIFGAIWSVVSTIASGLVTAWNWAMDLLGVKTVETGTTTGNVFATLATWGQWLQKQLTLAFNVIAYGIDNFGTVLKFVFVGAGYQITKFANEAIYFFTDAIPGVLTWFGNNWRDIFTTIWNFTKSVFINLGKNIGDFAAALWSFLKGDGFDFKFTGLLEGFENTVKELPKIAERRIGPLEQVLGDESARLGQKLGTGLADYLTEQERKSKGIADAIVNGIGNMPTLKTEVKTPEIKPTEFKIDESPAIESMDKIKSKAKETADALKLIVSGSAESQQLRAKAAFEQRMRSESASGAVATTATTKPLPGSATSAVRNESAKDNYIQKLVELVTTGNGTLLRIAKGVEEDQLQLATF